MIFEIDRNGVLKVSAIEKESGKSKTITITDRSQFSAQDIERMVEEAEKYAEENTANLARIESRNKLENYAYMLRNQMEDAEGLGGKFGEDDKQVLSGAIRALEDWLDENIAEAGADDFDRYLQALSDVVDSINSRITCLGWWHWRR